MPLRMGKPKKEGVVGSSTATSGRMKVTVCFGSVRVIVPCSQQMLVRDLMHQAVLRYKKAAGKSEDAWVVVHKLKSQSDGGILDLDDKLVDVADDREQIMAIYEEDHDGIPSLQHTAGDGTSASSVGTSSPDIFQDTEHKFQPFARTDIEITGEELNSGSMGGTNEGGGLSLQVRRGSEPALNRLSPVPINLPDPSKRWSAAPVIDEDVNSRVKESGEGGQDNGNVDNVTYASTGNNTVSTNNTITVSVLHEESNHTNGNVVEHYTKFLRTKSHGAVSSQIAGPSRFSRDMNRLSMQFFGEGSAKWSDAADRAFHLSRGNKSEDGIMDFAHSPTSSETSTTQRSRSEERPYFLRSQSPTPTEVIIHHEAGPLGIHLVPEHNAKGKNQGLVVQNVEKGSRTDRNGCLSVQDKIVEINGRSLIGVPFQMAQEMFREGLNSQKLRLKVIKQSPPQVERIDIINFDDKENMVHGEEKSVGDSKMATVSSIRKSPLPQQASKPNGSIPLLTSNTRKIGRKYEVDLQKGPEGLGFSITTRDNPAGGNCPIYIKYILSQGAAVDDGRLRPGDRLLEVNGIEMTGKSHSEALQILRSIPSGGIVKLVVSRQERVDLSPKLPRQIPPEQITEDLQPVPWTEKEILVFDIPVLDTEKAGLGISVKGKTEPHSDRGMADVGIFIKSVIHGGAASRDARLKPNDQLLSVNGVSLLNCSNTYAMETLRKTMTQDGPKPKPGYITLTVARRVPNSSAGATDLSGGGSSASGDETEIWGSKNVTACVVDGHSFDRDSHNTYVVEQEPMTRFSSLEKNGTFPTHASSAFTSKALDDLALKRPMELSINHNARNSSLRKIDALKGKFETLTPTTPSSVHQSRPSIDFPKNPVLERLTGKNFMAARTDSYYKATNDTSFSPTKGPMGRQNSKDLQSPRRGSVTLLGAGESVMVEDDYSIPQKPPRRSRSSTPEDSLDRIRPANVPRMVSPQAVPVTQAQVVLSDVTYASQTSLEDAEGFSRDAFGRQSMSEKRHATLDAKSTDTYQRNKKAREEKERQKHEKGHSARRSGEKGAHDQWSRRGVKRPLSSSTEDDLTGANIRSPSNEPMEESQTRSSRRGCSLSPSPQVHWAAQLSNKVNFGKGKPGDRLGLGDQLLQMLHHWGQKRMHRNEMGGLPRVNSADSLVDSLKMAAPLPRPSRHDRKAKGKKDIGPSLGMKKSSSLESLQTMVQEIVVEEDMKSGYVPPRSGSHAARVARGRGCNESFRQAVDRSYEASLSGLERQMETLAEEETESCLSGTTSAHYTTEQMEEKPRLPKKKAGGLFRGLGSMFRFGRHRKPNQPSSKSPDWDPQNPYGSNIDAIQEQYRRLAEKREARSNTYSSSTQDPVQDRQMKPVPPKPANVYRSGSGSMRVQKPSKNKPQEFVQQQDMNGNPPNMQHARSASASYDTYNDIMTRPGSRVGFADPKKYSHYINYDEIKQHLKPSPGNGDALSGVQLLQMRNTVVEQRKKAILESRRHQQHYHSQRRENPRERHERPVSNFYEYESVQAAMHAQQQLQHQQQQLPQGVPRGHGHGQYAMLPQDSRNDNNNGATLPSPTVPLAMGSLRQMSSSQFHAVPPFHQGSPIRGAIYESNSTESYNSHSNSQQRKSQISLARQQHHHKDNLNNNHQQQQQHSTAVYQRPNVLQPQQQYPTSSGRYNIPPSSSLGRISYQQQQHQAGGAQYSNHQQSQNYHYSTAQEAMQSQSRVTSILPQPSNGSAYGQTMSVGSKV